MYLSKPETRRRQFAEIGAFTNEQIAEKTGLNAQTVGRALDGEAIRTPTLKAFAEALGEDPARIVTFTRPAPAIEVEPA